MKPALKAMRLLFFFAIILSGCAINIPLNKSLDELIVVNSKPNINVSANLTYISYVSDTTVRPYNKDGGEQYSMHPGYMHTESAILESMLANYMRIRFPNNQSSNIDIVVTLGNFWIEQYPGESTGKNILVGLFGGELTTICVARLKGSVSVVHNDKKHIIDIDVATEDVFIQGFGTGTTTSNYDRGQNALQFVHARNINKANNRFILRINSILSGFDI